MIPSQRSKSNTVGLPTLYCHYRNRWYEYPYDITPYPYFPNEEISHHPNRLSYKEWKKLMLAYFDKIIEHIMEGKQYKFHHNVGTLELRKFKVKEKRPLISWAETNKIHGQENKLLPKGKKKLIYHKSPPGLKYLTKPIWQRRGKPLAKKWLWRFKLARSVKQRIYKKQLTDVTFINKIL